MVALSFVSSIWLASRLTIGAWPWLLLAAAAVLGVGLRLMRRGLLPAVLLAVFAAGLLWTQGWLAPQTPAPATYAVQGVVCGAPDTAEDNRVSFRLTRVRLNGAPAGDAHCVCFWYGDDAPPALFDGADVRFSARVYMPSGKDNEYDFDFRLWLLADGVSYGLTGVKELTVLNDAASAPWVDIGGRLRELFRARLERVMGPDARVAAALLLGEKDSMATDERTAFEALGVAHVMAVSGLHVGLLAGLLIGLMGRLRVSRRWQLPILAAFLAFYCLVTGFSPASVRAAVMALLTVGARALARQIDPLTLLSAALIAVLAINPLQLFTASFVLSFAAMGGILLITPRAQALLIRRSYKRRRKPRTPRERLRRRLRALYENLAGILAVSVGAQAGVYFPVAANFHRAPLYGLLFNLLILPLVGALVPLYAVTLALAGVPGLGAALGFAARLGSELLLWLTRLGASLPFASVRVPTYPALIVLAAAGCLWAVSPFVRARWRRRIPAMLLACAVAVLGVSLSAPDDLRYHQFSVGQGDAALLIDGPYAVAIDTGPYGSELADRLLAEGRDLDALILTHLHIDHVQGVAELLEQGIRIGRVYLPEGAESQRVDSTCLALLNELRASGVPVTELAAGDRLRYNRAVIDALWPEPGRARSGMDANARPLALMIDLGGARILSASDLTDGLDALIAQPCDVLKVAHHGSAEATSDALLALARPSAAIVTCSSASRTLPSADTLARLAAHGAQVYRTDETGELTLTVSDGTLRIHTYKARSSE